MKNKLLLIGIVSAITFTGYSQNTEVVESNIKKVIHQLFEGLEKGDSALVHPCFLEDAIMQTAYLNPKTENSKIVTEKLQNFLNAIGTPHDESWEERIGNLQIKVDENMAHAWMDYSFYLNGNFSHCGVNSIHLVHMNDGWKINHIIDTRRRKDCSEAIKSK